MHKQSISTIDNFFVVKIHSKNQTIEAGFNKRTLIAALIGLNNSHEYSLQYEKIINLGNMADGPDIIYDLSTIRTKGNKPLWARIIDETSFISATVPVYTARSGKQGIEPKELLEIILEQIENGVGMITIHPTPTKRLYDLAQSRLVPYTSRGGGIIIQDMSLKGWASENPYMLILPEIISSARKNDTVLSIGAAFRSANIFDSNDEVQKQEIEFQMEIAKDIAKAGVGVIIESPGHSKPKDIKNIASLLRNGGFPVMPLGPIPTDAAIGLDHVSAAIGATLLGLEGCAHILAAVTRQEHTGGNPSIEATVESVRAARIAAHIIDIHLLGDDSLDFEIALSRAKNKSCIEGKQNQECERCGYVCPLKNY